MSRIKLCRDRSCNDQLITCRLLISWVIFLNKSMFSDSSFLNVKSFCLLFFSSLFYDRKVNVFVAKQAMSGWKVEIKLKTCQREWVKDHKIIAFNYTKQEKYYLTLYFTIITCRKATIWLLIFGKSRGKHCNYHKISCILTCFSLGNPNSTYFTIFWLFTDQTTSQLIKN